MRKISIAALGATLAAALTATAWQPASAQQSGDSVVFLIPILENQPQPPAGPADKLIYTGGQVISVDVTGCGTGSRPMQNVVLVDPSGGRSGRIVGVITISQTDPVPPGTRLAGSSLRETCFLVATMTMYNKYEATVE
jgi:hypothetical protein